MSDAPNLLANAVSAKSRHQAVALLLSGGLDSVTVGLALENAGKALRAYTYRLQGHHSKDLRKAIAIADRFGWPLTVVTVPTSDVADDFIRLAVEQRCRKKTQFEVTYPLLYVLPQIEEAEVWTGWNADDHYGNTRECIFRQLRMVRRGLSAAERKAAFDEERRSQFEGPLSDPNSGDTWWYAHRLAAQHKKVLLDPYLDAIVRDYFLQFDHEQLSSLDKPLVRQAFAQELSRLPKGALAVGVQLQSGGGVDALFETLLQNSRINRFDKKYTTISALAQRWARETAENEVALLAELRALPRAAVPSMTLCKPSRYEPYSMADVHRASTVTKFTVVSTFAGGGGSCIGYHLAGGRVVLANEFVPEARRTYRANFPDTPIDERDIREIITTPASVEAFLAQASLRVGELDMLNGSPPCCEFSTGKKMRTDHSRLRPYSDVEQQNMDTLIFDYFELAKLARPKVVIAENIPALVERHGDLFEAAIDYLRFDSNPRSRSYYVNWVVLSSADFGVAQERRRLFVVGIRKDVGEAVGINSDGDVSAVFPAPTHAPVSIRSALARVQQTECETAPWRRAVRTSALGRIVNHLPAAPDQPTKPRHVGLPPGSWFSLTRCSWDSPAPTLTVMGQRPDGLSGALHPAETRKFTLPELKRLTGLPDDYRLTGTLGQASERICRMVPPLVIKALAHCIYERVLLPYKEI